MIGQDIDFARTMIARAHRPAWGGDQPSATIRAGGDQVGIAGSGRRFARQAPPLDRTVRQLWRDFRGLNLADARDRIDTAERDLLFEDVENAKQGYGDLFAIRAMTLAFEDDTQSAAAAADQALRLGASAEFAKLASLVIRFCAWKAGAAPSSNGASTLCALEATGAPSAAPNRALADVLDLTLAAAIEFSRLRVATAERLARCALKRAGRATATGASPASALARILYEQGQLEEAERLLRPLLPVIRAKGGPDCALHAYGVLARIAAHDGDRASAMAILDEGSDLAEARNWPRLLAAMLAERVRLCEPGDEARAATWLTRLRNLAERHRPLVRCARSEIACHLSKAQLYSFLTFRAGASPRPALAQLRYDAWLSQDLHASAWVSLAEAQVLWTEGEEERSVACLAETLRIAEATGSRQQLVDAGPLLPPIMARFLCGNGIEGGLLAFTICMADTLQCRPAPIPDKGRRAIRGGDGLSPREQAVLKLIGEGRTNKMIAHTQGVAPETVKTHIKNIFAKLGVERRAQAVAKAQRLGLLAT
jgi:ATP/maltotriose-dependent transcriptional regulator MalT